VARIGIKKITGGHMVHGRFVATRKAVVRNPTQSKFDKCVAQVSAKGGAVDPRAVCAKAGRKKYGKKKFQKMALAGKRRAAKNASYRKIKKEARKLQRAGTLDAGPMFQKWRKAAGISKAGKRRTAKARNAADTLGRKIDSLMKQIYAAQDPMQHERLMHGKTAKYKRMSKTYMSRIRRLEALQKQYREKHGIK
jgi:hypothetical protein